MKDIVRIDLAVQREDGSPINETQYKELLENLNDLIYASGYVASGGLVLMDVETYEEVFKHVGPRPPKPPR